MNTASLVCNLVIFIITAICTIGFFRKDGKWNLGNGRFAFRFFTVQSNVLCAVSALLMCVSPAQRWIWLIKYVGTAAVTVTMLTVFLFLGPNMGYGKLLKGADLFMHLITPLLAIVSFTVFEKRGLSFLEALLGVLPVLLYGAWYLYKTIFAPEEKRWDDFYGYNKGGKWPLSMAAMFVGTFLVSMAFMLAQNI